jgi:hypothetical protein
MISKKPKQTLQIKNVPYFEKNILVFFFHKNPRTPIPPIDKTFLFPRFLEKDISRLWEPMTDFSISYSFLDIPLISA